MSEELTVSKKTLIKWLVMTLACLLIIGYLVLNPFAGKAYTQPNKRLVVVCIGAVALFELHMLIVNFHPAIKYIKSLRGMEAVLAPLGYAVALVTFPVTGVVLSIIIQNNITDWFGYNKPPDSGYVRFMYSNTRKGTAYYIALSNGLELQVDEDFYDAVDKGDRIEYVERCSFVGCFVEQKTIAKRTLK